jgi:S1-C subfamily serine protease
MSRFWLVAFLAVIFISGLQALAQSKTEKELFRIATELDHAVIPIMYWGENFPTEPAPGVIGSAFFVNENGYFVTAAHVLEHYTPHSGKLGAILRQAGGSGSGQWFEVIDKDEKRDLALCRIEKYDAAAIVKMGKVNDKEFQLVVPWSLALSTEHVRTGQFVVVGGFPVGSWNPAVQMGHIAATKTINPTVERGHDLFQVSVGGNQGDSGGPVVDLHTGKVVGVVVRGYIQLHPQSSNVVIQMPTLWAGRSQGRFHFFQIDLFPGWHSGFLVLVSY